MWRQGAGIALKYPRNSKLIVGSSGPVGFLYAPYSDTKGSIVVSLNADCYRWIYVRYGLLVSGRSVQVDVGEIRLKNKPGFTVSRVCTTTLVDTTTSHEGETN
jgi:hypothetical protein